MNVMQQEISPQLLVAFLQEQLKEGGGGIPQDRQKEGGGTDSLMSAFLALQFASGVAAEVILTNIWLDIL